ncbi:MAG: cupin domain-containing protein [Saprospiraceae bacterium]|jgi:mannose-6-phosphate isomerase-like protein (cupin superfamily)|nr:cupin domain-containing protein [Saprospiraceae bacterium]MBK6815475.1 cupin domain-containing protein [Saprospiraceae bacterium]MBK7372506.1 cupin domain-containing protein [Saprospiraceae bacterium]MBK7439145.1 cupin domain-containing protein [Saprospiraceae bacterium]MBK7607934.1 cupin domain-containing protein [Saprospiraceae bacterium]
MHLPIDKSISALSKQSSPFIKLFTHGSLNIELYAPHLVDDQKPHTRDEVYIIVSGSGRFRNGDQIVDFGPKDFLFVPAGVEHKFFDFTDDFCTWVIFYGPEGGEKAAEYDGVKEQ